MKTTASKENSTSSKSSQPFFNNKREGGFLSSTNEQEQPFFSPNPGFQQSLLNSSFSAGNSVAHTPFSSPNTVFQTKLTINEPGDKHEQEADAMADRVMSMSAPVNASVNRNLMSLRLSQISNNSGTVQMQPKRPKRSNIVRIEHDNSPLSESQYKDWISNHPYHESIIITPEKGGERTADKKFSPGELKKEGFYYARKNVMDNYINEIWLNDEGEGKLIRIYFKKPSKKPKP